jgi:transcriptional regulator with XRE-family HTH domain
MSRKVSEEAKQECLRLRQQERLGLKEMVKKTGVSRGTIAGWLKDFPLTKEEIREKIINAHKGLRMGGRGKRKDRGEESKFSIMVSGKDLSRQDKAKIAESAVLFRLCLNRFVVYGSPFDGDKADWLIESIERPNKTYRIQVKWTKDQGEHGGLPYITLKAMSGGKFVRYKKGDFDFIVGYCLFNDTAYVYSFEEMEHLKSCITCSKDGEEAWHKISPK